MAPSITKGPLLGFTRLTKETGVARPSGILLQDSDGYDWYLWVDTTGDVRTTDATTAETAGFNWLTGGTVVGAQS
jgi:hypothetical protein